MAERQYSTKLINDIMQHPMDPAYESASAAGRKTSKFNIIIFALMIVMGFLIIQSVVYLTTAHQQSGTTGLLSEIQGQIEENNVIGETVQGISTELAKVREITDKMDSEKSKLESLTKYYALPLNGTGIVIEIDTANSSSSLKDLDLQAIVNRLFATGAEAVSVNGERLNSLSAIRTAGSTILVNLKHITNPYAISAIGDSNALLNGLRQSSAGGILAYLQETGASVIIKDEDVAIPGQSVRSELKYANIQIG
jgi:uncharacterized protein YlxW (UPF0749 family)